MSIKKLWNTDATTMAGVARLLLLVVAVMFLFNWGNVFTSNSAVVNYSINNWTDSSIDYDFVGKKVAQPFAPLDTSNESSGHFEKIAFRFVPYLIANLLNIGYPGLVCVQLVLGLVFPLLLWRVLYEATNAAALSTSGVLLVSGLYSGFAFFYDAIFFDAFAYFFLASAMLRIPGWARFSLLICAAFTDERAVLASFLIPSWHLVTMPELTRRAIWRAGIGQVGFLGVYALLRLVIGMITGLETGRSGIGLDVLYSNMTHIVLLVWSVFEGGWILIVLAAFQIHERGSPEERLLGIGILGCISCIFLGGLLVGDSIRSHQYAFPGLLIAIAVLSKDVHRISQRTLNLAIILTLVTPITIYLGNTINSEGKTVYNMFPLKPGYVQILGL
jgi:hypothetical protein